MSTDLTHLRALLAAATEDAWVYDEREQRLRAGDTVDADGILIGEIPNPHDAALIAAAVNALPELLDLADSGREMAEKLAESERLVERQRKERLRLELDLELQKSATSVEIDKAVVAEAKVAKLEAKLAAAERELERGADADGDECTCDCDSPAVDPACSCRGCHPK